MRTIQALSVLYLSLVLAACAVEEEAPPPPFTEIYMVGDGTPEGWNIQSPQPLVRDSANPYLWHWEGILHMGELSSPPTRGPGWRITSCR